MQGYHGFGTGEHFCILEWPRTLSAKRHLWLCTSSQEVPKELKKCFRRPGVEVSWSCRFRDFAFENQLIFMDSCGDSGFGAYHGKASGEEFFHRGMHKALTACHMRTSRQCSRQCRLQEIVNATNRHRLPAPRTSPYRDWWSNRFRCESLCFADSPFERDRQRWTPPNDCGSKHVTTEQVPFWNDPLTGAIVTRNFDHRSKYSSENKTCHLEKLLAWLF